MNYLLDTCVVLWALLDEKKKLKEFLPVLEDPSAEIFVSVVSYWEIIIKHTLGKITIPDNLSNLVEQTGFTWLNLELKHIENLKTLPLLHHDPFDRLLVAQSFSDDLHLLTPDKQILKYFK